MTNNSATEAAAGKADIVFRLTIMPTSLNDACRTMDEAATALEAQAKELAALREESERLDDITSELADRAATAKRRVKELEGERDDAREEAADSLRTLDAIAEYVGCPHDEELDVDHVRHHYVNLQNSAQRQGTVDGGRITNAEARAETAEQKVKQAEACCDSYADENQKLHDRMETAERELDASNADHRAMAKQLADLGRERDELRAYHTNLTEEYNRLRDDLWVTERKLDEARAALKRSSTAAVDRY